MESIKKAAAMIFAAIIAAGGWVSIADAGDYGSSHRFGLWGGRNSYTEIKVGYFDPEATSGTLLLGLETGSAVDEAVSFSLEVDFWRKKFEKKIDVDVDTSIINIPTTTTKVLYKHTVYYIPILVSLRFNIPMSPTSPVYPFAGVSAGYALSHIGYKFHDPDLIENGITSSPDEGYYGGWNWRIYGGAGIALGSMSKLNAGVMYNGATVKREESGGIERELDLSGFGFYASISFVGF